MDAARRLGPTLAALVVGGAVVLAVAACDPVEPAADATPTPAPTPTATPIPRPTPTPTATVYVVQTGDTLSGIATRFNVTVDDLVEANRIVNPDALQVGQEITIP